MREPEYAENVRAAAGIGEERKWLLNAIKKKLDQNYILKIIRNIMFKFVKSLFNLERQKTQNKQLRLRPATQSFKTANDCNANYQYKEIELNNILKKIDYYSSIGALYYSEPYPVNSAILNKLSSDGYIITEDKGFVTIAWNTLHREKHEKRGLLKDVEIKQEDIINI